MRIPSKAMLCSKLAIATALVVGATPAMAQGVNGSVTSSIGINAPGNVGNTTTITVTGQQAVVNWSATGPSGGGLTTFQNSAQTLTFQSGGNFAVLNNVAPSVATDAIYMNGTINSLVGPTGQQVTGGTVYFYSPRGIVIGDSGRINVGSLGLTTSPIASDGQGNWMTGFGTAEPSVIFGPAAVGSYVRIDNLAEVNANGSGNYVALVAPHVAHRGTIRTDGGAALVGASAATITFRTNNLYDIEITAGSTDITETGVVVDGGTIARNSQTIGEDHRAYLVAVPANTAMTMLVQGGSELGFDIAGSAGVEGNAVVLSAGRNIFNGEDVGPPNAPAASITIDNAAFTSDVVAHSTDIIQVSSWNGTTSFSGSLNATAKNILTVQATQNALSVGGNLTAVADNIGDNAIGGDVRIGAYNGATMTVGGNVVLSAGGFGFSATNDATNAGNGTGGSVLIQAAGGSTLNIGGSLSAAADGEGGAHGFSNGSAGDGKGGEVRLLANDSGSNVTIGGVTNLSAVGIGGSTIECSICSVSGGDGEGGQIDVNGAFGTGISLSFGGSLTLDADGEGGSGDALAGNGLGGNADLSSANGTTISVAGNLTATADGSGGFNTDDGAGGNGTGGDAFIGGFDGPGGTIGIGGGIKLSAIGAGGGAAGIGAGGIGTGGDAMINAPGVTISAGFDPYLFSEVLIYADGEGGSSSSGVGGAGYGGTANITTNGYGIDIDADVTLTAIGSGGSGRNGGIGDGGTASIYVASATANLLGAVTQDATGSGGFSNDPLDLGIGGSAIGGNSSMFADGGGIINVGQLYSYANAYGGSGGTGGAATAGSVANGGGAKVETAVGGAIIIDFIASLSASAYGGTGYLGAGGTALGGKVAVASRGTMEIGDSLYAYATGYGGSISDDVVPGGTGTGGQVDIFADDGGTLTLLSNVFGNASGQGGANFLLTSIGGTGQGGTVYYQASDGSSVNATGFVSLLAQGIGGYSGGDCSFCGGAGGDGFGGDVIVQVYGGTNSLTFASGLELDADGIGSGGYGGAGGDGSGGDAIVNLNNAGTIDITGDLTLTGRGEGGYQSNSGTAGNAIGGNAAVNLIGSAASLFEVGGTTVLDTSGVGGGTGLVGGGTAGNGGGGWSRIFGTDGQATFSGNVSVLSNGTGGTAFGGTGGNGVGGLTRVNTDGADYDFLADLSLAAISTGGNGMIGGDALAFIGNNPQGTATTDARILARNGTITVLGATSLNVSATGGNGSGGGAGGDSSSGYATVHARNSDLGPATITLGTLTIDASASGGDGGNGISSGNGGAGGSATGGFIAPTASAGNGRLIIGAVTIDGSATGGAGGDGGNGDTGAGGNGGAGGAAVGADLYIGTESGEAAALGINQGSASFASISSVLDAVGGAGGNGASGSTNGIGGAGGSAQGGDGYINARGSLVTIGAVTFTGHATGGAGGLNPFGAASGVGGDATAGGLGIGIANRAGNAAMRGRINAGAVSMSATATGGLGSTNGLGFAGGRNFFGIINGDATLASFSMFNVGSSGGDPDAVLDPFYVINGTATVLGDFTVVNPTIVSLMMDNGSLNVGGNLSITAGNFIHDIFNPPPTNLGTVSGGTITLVSNQDVIVDAQLVGSGDVLLDALGLIDVDDLTAGGDINPSDIDLRAGGSILFGDAVASGEIDFEAGQSVSGGDMTAGVGVNGDAAGAISLGAISAGLINPGGPADQGFSVGIASGTSITTGDVAGAESVGFATLGAISTGDIVAGTDVLVMASGNMSFGAITAGPNGRTYLADSSMFIAAGGPDDFIPELVFDAVPVASAGSITITGPVSTGSFQAAAASVSAGDISANSFVEMSASGAVSFDDLVAGNNITLTTGGSLTGGAVSAGGALIANSTGVLTLGNIDALTAAISGLSVTLGSVNLTGLFDAQSDSFFTSLDITTGESLVIDVVGNITTQAITTPAGVFLDAGGNISTGVLAAGDVELAAVGNIVVGNATVAESFSAEAGGTINAGSVTAGDDIDFEANGAVVVTGNLSAGLIDPSNNEFAEYNVGVVSATSVSLGNVAARGWVGIGTFGTVNVGSISSADDVLILADGNISSGAITTGGGNRLLIAGADMVQTGGGVDDFDRSIVFNAVDSGNGVATDGSVTIGGPVSTFQLNILAGTNVTVGDLNLGGSGDIEAGGLLTLNGNVTSEVHLTSSDIVVADGVTVEAAQLVSRNAQGTFVGDGLSGTDGYRLSNAEYNRFGELAVAADLALGAGSTMMIGDLTVANAGGADWDFAVIDGDGEGPGAGTIRVVGDVRFTGMVSDGDGEVNFMSRTFQLDAATGSISLEDDAGGLAGDLDITAQHVQVAETAILDRLALEPGYAELAADLAKPTTTAVPGGVIRAGNIYVYLEDGSQVAQGVGTNAVSPFSVYVQNSGTAAARAGFVANYAEIITNEGTPPGAIDLIVNGQLVVDGATLTGVAVRDALMEEDDPARFTSTSTINGCALTGPCILLQQPPPINPTPDIQAQFSLINLPSADDLLFGNEEAIEDNEEDGGEDSASSPIQPPTPLFNTKPLEVAGETDEPVSGGGNPALTGNGANPTDEEDDDEEDQ